MALGGGTFVTQNKILNGSYINFVAAAKASATLSDRGTVALPMLLNYAPDGVFTVTNDEFEKDSKKIFGYAYTDEALRNVREVFQNAKKVHFYNVITDSTAASCKYGTAKYKGVAGNDFKIRIETMLDDETKLKVCTLVKNIVVDEQIVDKQEGTTTNNQLEDNDYVKFNKTVLLEETASTSFTGGTTGTTIDYQTALDALEKYSFNTLTCTSTDSVTMDLFANYTERIREQVGVKFQLVSYKHEDADYEGVISVENTVLDDGAEPNSLVYWVAGAQANCAINRELTNTKYDGEYTVDVEYTQTELENGILDGKFMFHLNGDDVCVLDDINTLTTYDATRSADFSRNQTIRVLDQIGNDIATLFNTRYLGKIPNTKENRVGLWNDIVRHHQQMQELDAIENFKPEDITVEQGATKKSVVVTDYVTVTGTMAQLYMTVIVS